MRPTLRDEVRSFLEGRGAATASEIAIAIRARRDDVDAVLADAGFRRVSHPEGGNPRAAYFGLSQPVPQVEEGPFVGRLAVSDKDFLLRVLADGEWHSLSEIVSRSISRRGYGLTVHSRAADLRRDGYAVENRVVRPAGGGRAVSYYRLVGRVRVEPFTGRSSGSSSELEAA